MRLLDSNIKLCHLQQSARRDYKPELDKVVAERVRLRLHSDMHPCYSCHIFTQARAQSAKKADSVARLMADMKVSGGAPPTAAEQRKKDLEDFLEPDDEEEEDDDEGEIIDRSARTDYYDLPTEKRKRGTPAKGDEDDDGTVWPAP